MLYPCVPQFVALACLSLVCEGVFVTPDGNNLGLSLSLCRSLVLAHRRRVCLPRQTLSESWDWIDLARMGFVTTPSQVEGGQGVLR